MPLTYHQHTLDLIKQTPRIAEHHQAHINALEAYHGIELPPSVREFLMLENYRDLLRGNDDHILPVDIFEWQTSALVEHDPRWKQPVVRHDANSLSAWRRRLDDESLYFPFIIENQGVCRWSFALNAGDDPPVMMRINDPGESWQPHFSRFSEFVFARVFDWWSAPDTFQLNAARNREHVENQAILKFLSQNYDLVGTNEPGNTCRFQAASTRIMFVPGKVDDCWWMLFAETGDAFREMCRTLWDYIDFTSPYLNFWQNRERGVEILEELRRSPR